MRNREMGVALLSVLQENLEIILLRQEHAFCEAIKNGPQMRPVGGNQRRTALTSWRGQWFFQQLG